MSNSPAMNATEHLEAAVQSLGAKRTKALENADGNLVGIIDSDIRLLNAVVAIIKNGNSAYAENLLVKGRA